MIQVHCCHVVYLSRCKQKKQQKQEDYSMNLEEYLNQMVEEDRIFYREKDRTELINTINATQNGILLRNLRTLNYILSEIGMDYQIKEFKTTRYETDKNGAVKKRTYRHAWKVVRF